MSSRRLPLLLALTVALSMAAPAWAQQRGQGLGRPMPGVPMQGRPLQRAFPLPPPTWEPALRGGTDELAEAVRRIERSTGGKVLSAETMQWDGREVTRIKVIDERGRVRIFTDESRPDGDDAAPRLPRAPGRPSTRGNDD